MKKDKSSVNGPRFCSDVYDALTPEQFRETCRRANIVPNGLEKAVEYLNTLSNGVWAFNPVAGIQRMV